MAQVKHKQQNRRNRRNLIGGKIEIVREEFTEDLQHDVVFRKIAELLLRSKMRVVKR